MPGQPHTETSALIDYLVEAVREWTDDYDIRTPRSLEAALMFLVASLKGWADEPDRDHLADLMASAGGLIGVLAEEYQFPSGRDEEDEQP